MTRWILPVGRLDTLAATLTPARRWQLKAVAGTGALAAREEGRLLTALLEQAALEERPVVAAVVRTRDRSVLEGERRLVRVLVPGASRRWPPLLVAGVLPLPAADTPTLRRRWTVLAGFGLVVSGLTALVALVAVYLVLPAEQAVPECRGEDAPSSCISSFGEALYWAVTTVTTTGYGDLYPRSTTGTLAAAGLMLVGVIVVAGLLTSLVVRTVTDSMRRDHQLTDVVRGQATAAQWPARPPKAAAEDDKLQLRVQLQRTETLLRQVLDQQHDGGTAHRVPTRS